MMYLFAKSFMTATRFEGGNPTPEARLGTPESKPTLRARLATPTRTQTAQGEG